MFVIGEKYQLVTIEEGGETHCLYTVKAVEMPLITVVDGTGHEYIINTHSPNFVSANRWAQSQNSIYDVPPAPLMEID